MSCLYTQVKFLTEALAQKMMDLRQSVSALGSMRQRNLSVGVDGVNVIGCGWMAMSVGVDGNYVTEGVGNSQGTL